MKRRAQCNFPAAVRSKSRGSVTSVTPVDKNSEPLDAILRRAMRAQPGPATPECADAESLAAYSDQSIVGGGSRTSRNAFCRLRAMPAAVGGDRSRRRERARREGRRRGPMVSKMARRDSRACRRRRGCSFSLRYGVPQSRNRTAISSSRWRSVKLRPRTWPQSSHRFPPRSQPQHQARRFR